MLSPFRRSRIGFLFYALGVFYTLSGPAIAQDKYASETAVAVPGYWTDDGAWARSPAKLSALAPGGGVSIQTHGFAQVCWLLPGLQAGRVYRFRFDARASGQIEKVTLFVRDASVPYATLATEDLPVSGGRIAVDMQMKPAVNSGAYQVGLYLVIVGVGTVDIPEVMVSERADFLLAESSGPARGELVSNPRFLLGAGGWSLTGPARIGTPPRLELEAGARAVQEETSTLRMGRRYRVELEGKGGEAGLRLGLRLAEEKTLRQFAPVLRDGRWSETFEMELPPHGLLPKDRPVYLVLESRGPASITHIGLVEVAEDGSEPSAPAMAGARFERDGKRVVRAREGDPVDLVTRVSGVASGEAIVVRIIDWEGRPARELTARVVPLADGTAGAVFRDLRLPAGWYDTRVSRETDPPIGFLQQLYRRWFGPARPEETTLPVLPGELAVLQPLDSVRPASDWVLGSHLQIWQTISKSYGERRWKVADDATATLRTAAEFGIQSLRFHPPLSTKWWAVEVEKGTWVFPDDQIDTTVAAGFSVLGLLDGTAKYASTAPPAQLAASEGWPRNWAVFPPGDDKAWRNYVRTMVSRYRDRIRAWEIWNEPDSRGFLGINPQVQGNTSPEEVYVSLVKSAAEEIRAIDPGITIVAGAVTAVGRDFLLKCIDLGLLDSCDVISFHGYDQVKNANRGAPAFAGMVEPLRESMRRHGKVVPLWDTESSLAAIPDGRASIYPSEIEIKGLLARRAAGISRLYLYAGFRKGYPLHEDYRMLFGFNDRPLPIQAMLAANSRIVGGLAFEKNLGDEAKGEHVYLFEGGGRQVVAAWTSSGEDAIFAAEGVPVQGKILDIMGVETGVFRDGRLPLGKSVRYFVGEEKGT